MAEGREGRAEGRVEPKEVSCDFVYVYAAIAALPSILFMMTKSFTLDIIPALRMPHSNATEALM